MQNIEQKLVLRGAVGENASDGEPALVVGMKARLIVRAVDEAGDPAPPANLSDVASWKFVLAEDWDPATNPCFIADASWNPVTATWTVLLDGTRTEEMLAALGTEGVIDIGCEIAGLPANGTWDKPVYVAQWTMPMRNRRDSDGTPTPVDPSPVPSHAAQHAVGGVDPVTPASIGAASAQHSHAAVTDGDTTLAPVNGGTATISKSSPGNASVAFPAGFSITYGNDTYSTANGETVEFVGPYSVNGYLYWVPTTFPNPESFDPVQNSVWCLFASSSSATAPSDLMFKAGAAYHISNWDSTAPTLALAYGEASGGEPAMVRATVTDTKTVATTDQIPAAQVQSDWDQLDDTAKDFIKNKPHLRYALVSPTLSTSGTTVSATLQDRAVNAVTLASTVTAATFTFPAPVAGYARDFFLRLVIEGSTVPTISFLESGGGSLEDAFDADDDVWAEIEPGVNVLMFTETSQEAAP